MLLLIVIMIERKTENNILDSILAFDVRYRVFILNRIVSIMYIQFVALIPSNTSICKITFTKVYIVCILFIYSYKRDINENYIEEHQ